MLSCWIVFLALWQKGAHKRVGRGAGVMGRVNLVFRLFLFVTEPDRSEYYIWWFAGVKPAFLRY